MLLTLKVVDKDGNSKAVTEGEGDITLVHREEYQNGDQIILTSSEKNIFLKVQVDDALGSAYVYITKNEIVYKIPDTEGRRSLSPKTFTGNIHLLSARAAAKEEIGNYRNLAVNVMDQHGDTGCYPHASANVETRGESVFAAKNAIDGVIENHSHGEWPYSSWGINMREDAEFKLEFGRSVLAEEIHLYTRADFPHDNWWQRVTLTFSDGSNREWELEKSDKAHILVLEGKKIEWLMLHNLIKAEDPSPFPALTQIEVYGREV
ncbi:carbohydrate-binding protein [Anaerocolumna sp. AGMB13020]|uniref:carbohydrate-binding protein n=1 Tax=Anaerocolumna sp. AGMB13020 TaxID=3081750 RepID=UPI002954CC01|nr:carbohydrate-binding protein [Anaerocolumna sp. AGMB13020]WOO35364.1 carbohydrate-binding protein [Anaerocolumna sp. AGMB13020]